VPVSLGSVMKDLHLLFVFVWECLYAYVAYLHWRVRSHVFEPMSVGLAVTCWRALRRGAHGA
jgi:hypothetical protein